MSLLQTHRQPAAPPSPPCSQPSLNCLDLNKQQDQFASIDLCDNAIARLDGFPRLPRLRQLLLANNRLARVALGLGDLLPGLQTLVLTNNRLAELRDLAPLGAFGKTLTLLSLVGNPCAGRPRYRAYVLSLLPALKVLDFTKVKAQEREEARRQFPEGCAAPAPPVSAAAAPPAANGVAGGGGGAGAGAGAEAGGPEGAGGAAATAAEAAGGGGAAAGAGAATDGGGGGAGAAPPTQRQLLALQAAIAGAATLEEVERLEAALAAGQAMAPEEAAEMDAEAGGAEGRAGGEKEEGGGDG